MPVYIYKCKNCDLPLWEVQHSMTDDTPVLCDCGEQRSRVPQATGVVLKGGGFYKNEASKFVGNPDKGQPPALPKEFGGQLDTGK